MKYLNIGADFLLRSRVTLKPTFDVLLVLFSIQFLILEYLSIQQCLRDRTCMVCMKYEDTYTNSLVNADSSYANFAPMTFQ